MTIALVAGQIASNIGSAATLTLTLPAPPTTGNLVIVGVRSGATNCTVKDSNNNTYVATTKSPFTDTNSSKEYIFYLKNAPANATASITVSLTSATIEAWVAEYSGADTTAPFLNDATANGASSTNINSPALNPLYNGSLLIGVVAPANNITAATSPWTLIDIVQNGNATEYTIQTTASSQAIGATQGVAGTWGGIIAGFKASGATVNFGTLLGTLAVGKTSVTNPMAAVGSVSVSVGDLIFAAYSELTSDTVTGVTDNLGNTYTAQNAGSAATAAGRAFYSIATVAGTLTSVNFACTASTDDGAVVAAVFSKGPNGFATTPVDANPANITGDITSPFTCPSTGTLAQASELIIAWMSLTRGQTITAATSPLNLAVNQASTTGNTTSSVSACIGYQTVSATTAVVPNFTSASGTFSGSVLGTISFKENAAGSTFQITDTMAGAGSLVAALVEQEAILASLSGAGLMSAALTGASPVIASFAGAGSMTAALVELEQIVASFAGTGIMAGAGIPEQFDSSNFNGVGNLAVSLTEIEQITTQFNGSGLLSSNGIPEQFGSTNLNGVGNLGISLVEVEQILANLVGVGSLSSSLAEIMVIQTSLVGAGLLTANEIGPLSFAGASFVGAGALQSALTEIEQILTSFSGIGLFVTDLSGPQQFDGANFNGVGSLSTSLLEIEQIVASIVGTGSLTTSLTEIEQILVGFSGAGALAANTATPGPSANFNGVGSLVAAAMLKELVAATFAAVGTLQASTTQRELITAVLKGSGLLAVDLNIPGRVPILATLGGSGSFIASAQILEKAGVSLVGNGVLQSASSLITPATAIMSAAGSLTTDAKRSTPALALFQGAGNFASNGVLLLPIGTSFSGEGVLGSPQLQEIFAVVFSLSGSGNLQVDSIQILSVSSNFAGQGLLLTDIEQASANSLVFLGEGDLYAKLGHKVQFINDTNRTIYHAISRIVSVLGSRIISSSGGRGVS